MKKLVLICMFLSLTIPCAADVIYVDNDANGLNDGSSWADAYNLLQDGLDDADYDDNIWVAQGTYYPDPNGLADPREATFQMINGAAIYGGFDNTGDPGWGDRDPNQYQTILSGDLLRNDKPDTPLEDLLNDPNRADNCYHVFYHPDTLALDPNSVLDGFTITAGNADGTSPYKHGGGMFNRENTNPTLTNCTFAANSAYSSGGGLYNHFSDPTVSGCTFTRNLAHNGGGMRNLDSSPTVTGCRFISNSAQYWGGGMCIQMESNMTVTNCNFTGNSAEYGGGIFTDEIVSLTIINCTFTGNSADFEGGGILTGAGSPTVTKCAFTENTAGSNGGGISNYSNAKVTSCTFTGNTAFRGGGMYNYESNPIVTNCTFTGNSAGLYKQGGYGGGMLNRYGSPTVTNCTFIGNSAKWSGGGMVNWYCTTTVINCTFTSNSADGYDEIGGFGGGMDNGPGNPTVISCTFSGNFADLDGGAMYNYWNSIPTVANCTFTGNTAENGNAVACDSSNPLYTSDVQMTNCIIWDGENEIWNNNASTITITYSDVQGDWPGLGNINVDPNFVDPGYWDPNGTPSIGLDDFWVDGDYHLKSNGWRWDNDANNWTWDDVTSRCIDAGNPGALLGNEPMTLDVDPLNRWGENLRINMGAFGGSPQASMSPYDSALLADLTNDGIVNLVDFANQAKDWQNTAPEQPGNLNRDGAVDLSDALLMANDWLKTTSWY